MTTTQREAIERHGRNLLAIFPAATEQDPVALCKCLRRLEAEGQRLALRMCNGPEFPDEAEIERLDESILRRVNALLCNVHHCVPIFVNHDPRGYALKIDDTWMRKHPQFALQQDWGGYGIIAPEIGKDG